MTLAIFEAYYSRPIAPTRRVALGRMMLPIDPAPGFGGVLLGGIMARFVRELDADLDEELDALVDDLEVGRHIGQPRLRHRLQVDRVGLARCRHRLEADGEQFRFDFESNIGTPTQHVLCAAYAASQVETEERASLFTAIRKGLDWVGPIDDALVRDLSDRRTLVASAGSYPKGGALERLGIAGSLSGEALHAEVSRSFRELLIQAHPDHGGSVELAADRIAELREARRILIP